MVLRDNIRLALATERAKGHGLAWALGHHTLYKYKGYAGESRRHVMDIIQSSRLFFSTADQFNDPFELRPVFNLAGDSNDAEFIRELEAEQLAFLRKRNTPKEEVERLRAEVGVSVDALAEAVTTGVRALLRDSERVFCFSTEQRHPLLWSHYADRHRGVCLHFKCQPGGATGLAQMVQYREERVPILIPFNQQQSLQAVQDMAITKADFWRYENECRIVASDGVDWGSRLEDGFLQFEPELLTGLTLGMLMEDDCRQELIQLAAEHRPRISVFEAVEDRSRFWLDIRSLP